MGVELEVKSASELKLMDDNKVPRIWGEIASQQEEDEKKKVEEERARAKEERAKATEAIKKVKEANMRVKEAMKRVEEAEVKAIRAIEIWRESLTFDALA